jgi:hypothetical protein
VTTASVSGLPGLAGLPWKRAARWGIWWIPDEAPGGLGSPELWMDCAAMDGYGRGDAAPAVTVSQASPQTWLDAIVRFGFYEGIIPDQVPPCVYIVDVRRTSTANLNRPYYVLRWPD